MPNAIPTRSEKRSVELRRMLVPAWLWQLTWLRHLPRFLRTIVWKDCPRPRWKVAMDMLHIFFRLRTVPEHYGPCRLWEAPKQDWPKYYGSPYTPVQRDRLARRVYHFEYQVLYNDKVACARLCEGLHIRQPRIFAVLHPKPSIRAELADLLGSSERGELMLKPVFGRSGLGIVVVERRDAGPVVRTSRGQIPLADFMFDVPMFVQEVIHQDPRMATIWGSSVNTIRVVTLLTPGGEVLIAGCAMRTGVGKSFVDNWSAGGVAIGIDAATGRLRKYGYDIVGNRYSAHPSSGVQFDGFVVPEWQRILDLARRIQRDLPYSKLAGADICLDQQGHPVLIELNGLPDLIFIEQLNGPLLADDRVLRAFAEYDLLVSGPQKRLLQWATGRQPSTTPG